MKNITALIIFFFLAFQVCAQTSEEIEEKKENLVLIIKNSGGEYIGEIISDDGREILLITKTIGKIYINKSEISSISKVEENLKTNKNGEFRASGPFTTRYYFTNNALPIKKNENYALVHVYGPEIHFSVGNKTSLGIMASWIASPIGLVLKQQVYSKNKFHVSIGSILGSSGYINQGQTYGGLHWGTVTIGDRTSNISFSAGLAHINWPTNNTDFMSNVREMGDRYSYSFYDQNHPYFIAEDDYNSQMAFEDSIGIYDWNGFSNSNDRYLYRNKQLATVIGVSGIAPIGKKASFIFDSMIFIANKSKVNYTKKEKEINYERYNNATGNSQLTSFTAVYGEGIISPGTYRNITFILMPAMRFNQSYEKAFQVALAGFINYDEINGLNSAPVPMISWLRKF
ncbi:MAG: hypothetical protein QNK57_04435 [Flavobacteriales bacterium]